MTHAPLRLVPDDATVYTGPRGSHFFFRNGKKVYITDKEPKKRTQFNLKRGAFQRFIENQAQNI